MILLQKTIQVDSYMLQVGIWLLVFLFTSLLGIIGWLAKTMTSKVDSLAETVNKQTVDINEAKIIAISTKEDTIEIYDTLKTIPEIKLQLNNIENTSKNIEKDVNTLTARVNKHSERLSELERTVGIHAQYLRTKESQ